MNEFLRGDRVYLRPLQEGDAHGRYVEWLNDADVCSGNSHHVFPYTSAQAIDYIRRAEQSRDALILAVVLRDGDRHIGNVALQDIHPLYRSAEFAIVIGERDVWGQGYSREAGALVVHHGFTALNLHRIQCGTFADNTAMRKLALALGMREEGCRREAAFKGGRYVDVIEFAVLRAEYEQRQRTASSDTTPRR